MSFSSAPHPNHRRRSDDSRLARLAREFSSGHSTGGLLAVPYGILVAFLAIALMWWTDNRSEITYGMSGPMTTITTMNSTRSATEEQKAQAARELRTFLSENDSSSFMVSKGDCPPVLGVFDPNHRSDGRSPSMPPVVLPIQSLACTPLKVLIRTRRGYLPDRLH